MKRFIMALVLAFGLTGCSSLSEYGNVAQNTLSTVTAATNIVYEYDNGQIVDYLDQAKLTDMELGQILEALDQVDRSKAKLIQYKDNPLELVQNIGDVTLQYIKIKNSYLGVRFIVTQHWDEYSEIQKQVYITFDQYAQNLDGEFSKMIDAIDANSAINTALALASTGLKLAVML